MTCVSMAIFLVFITLLTATDNLNVQEGPLLCFYGNNAYANEPHCYVIRILRILFGM